jgi:hypothetical protein
MLRIASILVLAVSLAACEKMINTVTEGFKNAKAVESDLEQSTGSRPQVGFNWNNGRLVSVTVIYPGLYETKPLRELAGLTRAAVTKQFKQTPDNIVLGFALGKDAGTVAQMQPAP